MLSNKVLLHSNTHRPWPLPTGPWKYYQEWNRAIFLHWEVEAEKLKKQLPEGLELDLIEGKAWVSLVAFTMEKIRPRFLPAFAPVSNFDEINIRTYVKHQGKAGVHFLSIEAAKTISCVVAKTISELPYRYSSMERTATSFTSRNKAFEDSFNIQFNLGGAIHKQAIDKFLTERYALFQDGKNGINAFDIHHVEWPIQELRINDLRVNYQRFSSFLNDSPDLYHYSSGVQVLAWEKRNFE